MSTVLLINFNRLLLQLRKKKFDVRYFLYNFSVVKMWWELHAKGKICCERGIKKPLKNKLMMLKENWQWLNQEVFVQKTRMTRWSSYYRTLLNVVECFSSIVKVREYVQNDGFKDSKKRQAHGLLRYINIFDFVFFFCKWWLAF